MLRALVFFSFSVLLSFGACSKGRGNNNGPINNDTLPANAIKVGNWITNPDQSMLLSKQADLSFTSPANSYSFVDVDSTQTMQSVEGFGFSLTGGSAYVINKLSNTEKQNLLKELFGNDANSIGISYLRISIGASDLSGSVFSYDDMPPGQTDTSLDHFNLAPDTADLIPVLRAILLINPNIKILGSPWSPPVWMKDNGRSIGGSLLPQYYHVYAQYFVKYIQQMKASGVNIDAVTLQNEPLYGGNNPSMIMTASQQADFIRNHVGPAFQVAGINTKIILYDHNCDHSDYPITILNDPAARAYVSGTAFHLYAGDISALSTVHNAYPDKGMYFTEQWTGANEGFENNLRWHMKNVIIGSMRNWSKVALEWNLANDPAYSPHTPGGCTECKGALTIGTNINKNVGYYIIGHASKFVPPGSVRISSNNVGNLQNVAFITSEGKKVLIAENDNNSAITFNIRFKGKWFVASLPAGAAATYVW